MCYFFFLFFWCFGKSYQLLNCCSTIPVYTTNKSQHPFAGSCSICYVISWAQFYGFFLFLPHSFFLCGGREADLLVYHVHLPCSVKIICSLSLHVFEVAGLF